MAQRAIGTKLQINATAIAELTDVSGLDVTAGTVDTTTLDSVGNFKTFISSFKDGGEVSISGFFNAGDTGNQALWTALSNGTIDNYTITFPSAVGASWTFQGIVTEYKTDAKLADAISFDGKIKVTGQPTLALTSSANLTTLVGTGITLAPVFAGGTYYYTATTSATSYTVTATLTGATYSVYMNGALISGNLASGTASASIPISGVGTTQDIVVIYSTASGAQKQYEIVVYKNA